MSKHLSIGQFAKSVRLSIKALRRYDAEGLLKPAIVDPYTGYRYYTPEQSREAVTIAMLRRLEVPLATIQQLLQSSEVAKRHQLLDAQRARLARELAEKQAALASVERLLGAQQLLPHLVQLIEEPTLRIAAYSFETVSDEMEADTTAAVSLLFEELSKEALPFAEPMQCLMFEPDAEGRRTLTVCLALPEGKPSHPQIRVETLPGGMVAKTRHVGPYSQLGLAHFALHAYLQERGHTPSGPVREQYINDPREVSPSEIITDLLLPLDTSKLAN